MTETELAGAIFGLFVAAMIWVPLLMIDRWNQAEINRLRARIDSLQDRIFAPMTEFSDGRDHSYDEHVSPTH